MTCHQGSGPADAIQYPLQPLQNSRERVRFQAGLPKFDGGGDGNQ